MDQRDTTPVSVANVANVANARVAPSAPPSPRSATMPPIHRGAMTPVPWLGLTRGLLHKAMPRDADTVAPEADPLAPPPAWEMAAWLRRRALSLMIVFATVIATIVLSNVPLAPAPRQAQGRQRRRLLPPLGPAITAT
jgi:membrane glycosyltransferase